MHGRSGYTLTERMQIGSRREQPMHVDQIRTRISIRGTTRKEHEAVQLRASCLRTPPISCLQPNPTFFIRRRHRSMNSSIFRILSLKRASGSRSKGRKCWFRSNKASIPPVSMGWWYQYCIGRMRHYLSIGLAPQVRA